MKDMNYFYLHILLGGYWQEPMEFSTETLALDYAEKMEGEYTDWYITKGDDNTPIHSL